MLRILTAHIRLGGMVSRIIPLLINDLCGTPEGDSVNSQSSTPNLLIRSQNQGVRAPLEIQWNPSCPLGFRLSLVRIVLGCFSSSRGPNAD